MPVSYTHLDVYKRQVLQLLQTDYGLNNASDVLLGGGSAGAIGVFMNVSFVSGLLPLQTRLVGLPDASFVLSSYPDYDPATGGDTQPPTNYQISMAEGQSPVSYTHLDVYKRQPRMYSPKTARIGSHYSSAQAIRTIIYWVNMASPRP